MHVHQYTFTSDPAATKRRVEALRGYLSRNVLRGTQFVCKYQSVCKESHNGPFYEGQLHHVGRHYDLSCNGNPLRVVIVGQEYGHGDTLVSLKSRHDMIAEGSGLQSRFAATKGYRSRNPHMKGCTNALRLIFGLGLGSNHDDEFINIGETAVHSFECFALVNFLLCSAVSKETGQLLQMRRPGGKAGRSSVTMSQNCARHFKKALDILSPNLIIAQGVGVRKWMQQTVHMSKSAPTTCVESIEIGQTDAVLVSLSHPSAHHPLNWGASSATKYLLETVEPAIERAVGLVLGMRPNNLRR